MASSQSSQWNVEDGANAHRLCYCGELSPVRTARTEGNYGRRFVGCGRYGIQPTCRYFEWIDPPMCPRARQIIPRIVQKVNVLRSELEISRRRERCYGRGLIGSCIVIFGLAIGWYWNRCEERTH